MKILFVTANLYMPQAYGGMQTTADQLCRDLIRRGHEVAILARFTREGIWGLKLSLQKKIFRRRISRDTKFGYPVWRAWFPWEVVQEATQQEKPDLIVVMAVEPVRMALAAKQTGIPILMMLQDVEFDKHGGDFRELGNVACIANSKFTANKYQHAYGVTPHVIYPFISLDKYQIESTKINVTFINPVPEKGCDRVLEIAKQCPEIPFSLIEGWPLSKGQKERLLKQLSVLPNVKLLPSHSDMRDVYRKCKILLVPSIWEEAYGMVVTEAQISGIPVIASARGGLPEAVGPGGILLNPDGPIDKWVDAIKKLWRDEHYYTELSHVAHVYAQRPEMNAEYQVNAYEKAFMSACDMNSRRT